MYGDSSILEGASQACIDTFNSNVSCPQAIGSLYADPYPDFDKTVLDALCTKTCFNSLLSLRSSLVSKCGSGVTYQDVTDGSYWPVTYLADLAIFNYNMTCLERSDGQYCNTWFQTGANATTSPECDECYIETVYMQAESPLQGDAEEMQSIYASMTSSCSYHGAATKTVVPIMISSPTATPTCTSQYKINPGDTAVGVSLSQQVATQDLLTANGLNYTKNSFPTSGTLCIRDQCKIYTLKSGDTCYSLSAAQGLSQAKLLSWNPFINGHCDNIANFVGETICLTNPLGDYSVANNTDSGYYTEPAPVPADIAPNTTTNCGLYYETTLGDDCGVITLKYTISLNDFIFLNPMIWENCTNLWANTSYCTAPVGHISDYPGYGDDEPVFTINPDPTTARPYINPFADDEDAVSIPLANATRTDCWDYLWWNSSLGSPISCWSVVVQAEITREEFVLWNPSLDQNGDSDNDTATRTYDYDCTIAPSVSYCTAVASPTAEISKSTAPFSPRAAGEIANCTEWFRSSLSCDSHLSMLRMSLADFYRFNPSVKADCSNYVLGTYYCYSTNENGVPPERPSTTIASTTTKPTTTSSVGATPLPTQDGMAAGCTAFYFVVSGDGCWAIANDHGITLDNLYLWNPALNGDCSGLFPGYYVCISRTPVSTSITKPSTTTPKTSTLISTLKTSTITSKPPITSTKTISTAPTPTKAISDNGTCGGTGGKTCLNSAFGNCCSSSGFCGSSSAYCTYP
ncbi:carbohydrate-binding module family 18 protein [Melanomma pulvis-pyrius CBS 109.77]|uniref:Carbohydrate-binding module family 18 protein n=1 Tax=Melanomma pulvis-pyrius CBS 109.77 TaxID=1314802 RepID=A0A6A6X4B9_9PLEO|nr:carbohydrate-binding module family 18 protein [Melanomma pulvis-pyrius CBS 109.77]